MRQARNVTADQQSLAGEWNTRDTAALIARRLADQQMRRLDAQMRRQPLTTSAWPVTGAIIAIAIGPRIEHVCGTVALQE